MERRNNKRPEQHHIRSTFFFSFEVSAAKRLRFDPKEKQCLKEMESGARGHLNRFVH
jgi:hypothetical protein